MPTVEDQLALRLFFFDHHLKGEANGVDRWPAVRYYNLGEEVFREAASWPPGELRRARWHFREERALAPDPPAEGDGADAYRIDFGVTTGTTNRWTTQLGGPVAGLSQRGPMDARMLTYTSDPLIADVQVTGAPVVSLRVASDHEDGTFLAYLEDVDESGRSRYLTEGGLRAIQRRLWHSPRFGDGPLSPGQVAEIRFHMWPISVLFRAGHRIRVAIAGADAGTFDRLPSEGTPTITVHRNAERASFIELPTLAR